MREYPMIAWSDLSDCVFARWSPKIGDASVMGWVTVAAYGGAALLCAVAFSRAPDRAVRVFGWALAVLLAALMVNKQLDLQSAFTATGRCISQIQGWYEHRQQFQFRFILGLLAVCAILGAGAFWLMRQHLRQVWLALLGLLLVISFVAVRAVGFHHFDEVINFRVKDVRMNWVLELSGLVLISINAIWLLFRRD
ncbi:isopropylmalate isomerase [Sedimentitalea sp. JM2-8]|uniref:Isopropylmalate isomerase n=1 Tax=Sedimentitalea xiamensis TaxID=3050037 RepID=A0ABT7FCT0_9RHOB|nr:isopropylmalate isomerase [Sedimentitalea xiamensis]MDK3072925.1 isopropylmalate isomerase [Sedimentitalea xiamensis]